MNFESEGKIRGSAQSKRGYRGKKAFVIFCVLAMGAFFGWSHISKKEAEKVVQDSNANVEEKIPEELGENIVSHIVSEGDIPADVFAEYGKFNPNDIEAILNASENIYDFAKIKIGQELQFFFKEGEKACKIKYYPDTENVVIVETDGNTFKTKKEDIPYEVNEETFYVKIDEFLYKDALDAGLSEASILEVADVFSFDVDFTTEIREGDELKVVYEKRTLNGKPASDGKILAAKFINAGQEYFAYYFEFKGEGNHYDAEGHELVRQFLRAPLSYRKITSGYTGARYHPITKTVTSHYQIDYAAPSGTPVVSTARGTVSSAGWEGGWGNMVRLVHDNGYTTHYGHLSGYGNGIRSGVSVAQGQIVGYVGSTGWSTGPHLDYGMKLNGSPVNPLSLKLPKGTSLAEEEMRKFQEEKTKYGDLLK